MKKRLVFFIVVMSLFTLCFSSITQAAYPEKPVTFIMPFPPGGAGDQQGRLIENEFREEFGQPATLVFRLGANGAIAATEMKSLKPDGYSIGVHTHPILLLNTALSKGQYSVDDFEYLCGSTVDQVLLITAKDSPIKTFADLEAAVKSGGKTVTMGSVDILGQTQIPALRLKAAGLNMRLVPFEGGAKALVALLGNHVDTLMAAKGNTMMSLSKVNVLAICSDQPDPELPGVPTLKSLGYDITSSLTRLWYAPKGLPPDVRARLVDGLKNIYSRPDVAEKHAKVGMPVIYKDPDTLYKEIKSLEAQLPELIKLFEENK